MMMDSQKVTNFDFPVIPAKAGIQYFRTPRRSEWNWVNCLAISHLNQEGHNDGQQPNICLGSWIDPAMETC